jgi:hypothetical protein
MGPPPQPTGLREIPQQQNIASAYQPAGYHTPNQPILAPQYTPPPHQLSSCPAMYQPHNVCGTPEDQYILPSSTAVAASLITPLALRPSPASPCAHGPPALMKRNCRPDMSSLQKRARHWASSAFHLSASGQNETILRTTDILISILVLVLFALVLLTPPLLARLLLVLLLPALTLAKKIGLQKRFLSRRIDHLHVV